MDANLQQGLGHRRSPEEISRDTGSKTNVDDPLRHPACIIGFLEDDAEQTIQHLVKEIIAKAQDIIFERHISTQIKPFAVEFALDAIIKIVDWEFFYEDKVDVDSEIWSPENEPPRVAIDSYAKGVMYPEFMQDIHKTPLCRFDNSLKRPIVEWQATLDSNTYASERGLFVIIPK